MKPLIFILSLIGLIQISIAEEFTVYTMVGQGADIEWGEKADEDTTTYLNVYRLGKELGKIDDDSINLQTILKQAIAYDSSQDPFFGPGYAYLLQNNKGEVFSATIEYEKDHKTFHGFRGQLNKLQPIGHIKGVYIDPSSTQNSSGGSIFHKELLKQLKILANKEIHMKKSKRNQ